MPYLAIDGICSGHDTTPGVQTGVNPSLGDGHGLLLHDFVNSHPVHIRHLVKLVDTHHAPVRQHHRASLQPPLARILIRRHSGRQTHTRTSPTSGRDRQRRDVQHESQQLRFRGGRVADHE